MAYALIDGGEIAQYPYSLGQLRRDNPETSFGAEPGAECLAEFGVAIVAEIDPPEASDAQRVGEGPPELVDGKWRQTWNVTDIPPEEIRAAIRPVSMRQARLALLAAGKLADVDTALNAMPSPQKEAAEIEWEYASEVRRDSPLIAALGGALGMSEDQIDDLFAAAAML